LQIKSTFADSSPVIFLRGVGINDFNANSGSGVAVYLDDVYQGLSIGRLFQFFDISRTEVLKGPQGTLFGRNATGGAINIASTKPSDRWQGYSNLEYGRYNEVDLEAAAGGPIVADLLKVRVSGRYNRRDGIVLNRVANLRDGGKRDRLALRGLIEITPSNRLSVLLNVNGGRSNSAGGLQHRGLIPTAPQFADAATGLCAAEFFGTANCTDVLGYADTDNDVFEADYDRQGSERVRAFGTNATINWDLDWAALTSVSAYGFAKRFAITDEDSSPNAISHGIYDERGRQWSQEVRLTSQGDGPTQWLVGGFYYREKLGSDGAYDIGGSFRPLFEEAGFPGGFVSIDQFAEAGGVAFLARYPYTQRTESWALFSQVTQRLAEKIRLTGGLRYSRDIIGFDYRSFYDEPAVSDQPIPTEAVTDTQTRSGRLSWRAALDYMPREGALVFASVSTGYNSGGFNGALQTFAVELQPFRPETLTAYELGTKLSLFNRRMRVESSIFQYDYNDMQVFTLLSVGVPVAVKRNAASARIRGAEVSVVSRIIRGVDLSMGGSFLDARFGRFVDGENDFTGNKLTGAPRWSGQIAADWTTELAEGSAIRARIDANVQSRVYFDTTNAERLSQGAYGLVNLRLGWQFGDERYEIYGWGRNVTGTRFAADIISLQDFGFDQIAYGEPTTFGIGFRLTLP
jgi:iron complex outermembrane receptor protein